MLTWQDEIAVNRKKNLMTKSKSEIRKSALQTLNIEAQSIIGLQKYIDDDFISATQVIAKTKGRVIVSGIGKSAIIAQKIVATFNSTGTPAIFMHAADAIHGDLGIIQKDDVVICISKSGDTPEIKVLIPLLKSWGNYLIAMTGNAKSFLAKQSHYVLNTYVAKEACPNNLAPTSSSTAQMAMGDALAVCLLKLKGFSSTDFAKYHPGGALGKKLYLKVGDLYLNNSIPMVHSNTDIKDVILEISSKRLGATAVIDKGILKGMITDGDLRRMLLNKNNKAQFAKDIMNKKPKTISADAMAADALVVMKQHNITQLVVLNKKKYVGIIHLHDLLREGIL